VPLDPPGTLLTPRVNQLDLSFSKRITVGSIKFDPKIDIFNALNSDDYFTVRTTTFVPVANASQATRPPSAPARAALTCSRAASWGRIIRLGAVVPGRRPGG
jgi:hypothetical protein